MDFNNTNYDDTIRELITHVPENTTKPNKKPKRPPNAFNLFFTKNRLILKEAHPQMGGNEISKIIGNMWSELTEEQKKPFVEEAKEIRLQFKRENPNWHYGKKENKKNKNLKDPLSIYYETDVHGAVEEEIEGDLSAIGALALSQFILSRKDLQEDVFDFIKNQKSQTDISPFDETHF